MAMGFFVALGLCTAFALPASQALADTWKKPACASGNTLEKRSGKNEWRCKKFSQNRYVYRPKGTSTATGRCLSVLGIGYFWAKRGGVWKCCGTSPAGETCKNFNSNVGRCPSTYSKRDTGNGAQVCRKRITVFNYSDPIWVD
jgi:hypothetical protein